jgi:imidazolonepropionase-like amidohydrolase
MASSKSDTDCCYHPVTGEQNPSLANIPAPDRKEGQDSPGGLILRGVNIIDGTGAPAYGPADIVIQNGRIVEIIDWHDPIANLLRPSRDPRETYPNARVMDLQGHYVLPGMIDSHAHIGGRKQAPSSEYVYKLWLGHGVTTVRDVACAFNGLKFTAEEARRSDAGEICAPRILPYPFFGEGSQKPISDANEAARWVASAAERGAKGVKFFGAAPAAFEAALKEIQKLGMGSACHHEQRRVSQINAMTTARWGLGSIEHWYGLPEAMFENQRVQNFAAGYNYSDEPARYASGGPLWMQTAAPGSQRWNDTIDEFVELGVTMDPTFNIYIGHRDAARVRNSEWHEDYTAPQLWDFFEPNAENHGSVYGDWGTEQEIPWRHGYQRWMALVNDFKNRGGRVTVGADSGFIYKTYGFGQIEELELFREAGFHPLEIIRSATLSGAELAGLQDEIGSIELGKRADLMILDENPLENLKVLYGHGHLRQTENGMERVGGVKYTLRDGTVYDAAELRKDVRDIVADERERLATEKNHSNLHPSEPLELATTT